MSTRSLRATFETIGPAVLSFHRTLAQQAFVMRELLAGLEAMDETEFVEVTTADAEAEPTLVQLMRTTTEDIFSVLGDGQTLALAKSCAEIAAIVQRRTKEIVERRRSLGLE